MREIGLNLMKFFEDESCGQCTPCRNGNLCCKTYERKNGYWTNKFSKTMNKASICGLGQAAPNPLQSIINHFWKDVKND